MSVVESGVVDGIEVRHVIFEIHFLFEPTQNTYNFLKQIPGRINGLDLSIECHVTEDESEQ